MSGPRTVRHAAGVSEVPQDPDRVVTLGGLYTGAALAVGVVPVAVGDSDARELSVYDDLLPADVDLAGLPTVGDPYAPNAEALLAAEPDLLLGDEFQEQYERLAEIAPTVLVRYRSNGGWRERFPDLAEALGRSDRVAEVDRAYQADLDAFPDAAREQTTAFVRAEPGGTFRIDGLAAAFAGSVAEDGAQGHSPGAPRRSAEGR